MANVMEDRKQKKQANFFMKVVVIGDSGVGKTSILQSYINPNIDITDSTHKATIGSDLYMTDLSIENNYAQLQIWDTAGTERFNALSKQLYRGADILVLVYDITNSESFANIEQWKNQFLSSLNDDHPKPFPTLLLGNKMDLDSDRQVALDEALEYADGHDMIFKEVSAVTKMNISPAFQDIALIAMNKVSIPLVYKIDESFVLPATYYANETKTGTNNGTPDSASCNCLLL